MLTRTSEDAIGINYDHYYINNKKTEGVEVACAEKLIISHCNCLYYVDSIRVNVERASSSGEICQARIG